MTLRGFPIVPMESSTQRSVQIGTTVPTSLLRPDPPGAMLGATKPVERSVDMRPEFPMRLLRLFLPLRPPRGS
jgi:hypothetical protein